MKITVEFEDNTSFTIEEAIQNNRILFGSEAIVKVEPNNSSPEEYIYHAIKSLITVDQLTYFYEYSISNLYDEKLEYLRQEVLVLVDKLFDKVVDDNEEKIKE